MKIIQNIRLFETAIASLILLGFAGTAHAANIQISQQNNFNFYGEWQLHTQNKIIHGNELEKTVKNLPLGDYELIVNPPYNAITNISFYMNGEKIKSVKSKKAIFQVNKEVDLSIVIEYEYKGEITVTSLPSGATFEITAMPGMRWTGTAPTTFSNMPPMEYIVHFSQMDGYFLPSPQKGKIREDFQSVRFSGIYEYATNNNLDLKMHNQNINQVYSSVQRSDITNISLWNTFHQAEGLPGTNVFMTIGIRNLGKGTLNNISVSQSFNPNQIKMPSSIPQKGSMEKDGLVVWNIPKIYAGQNWTAKFPVSLNAELKTGEQVITTARVSGDNIIAENDKLLNKTSILGIAFLPQTGEETEKLIFILLISAISITLASETRRKNNVIHTV